MQRKDGEKEIAFAVGLILGQEKALECLGEGPLFDGGGEDTLTSAAAIRRLRKAPLRRGPELRAKQNLDTGMLNLLWNISLASEVKLRGRSPNTV